MTSTILRRASVTAGFTICLAVLFAASGGFAQPPGKGPPPGKGKGKDKAFAADQDGIHFLLANGKDIKRTVKETKNGVETVTESEKPVVAKRIQEHVAAMHVRVKDGVGIHLRDPLFVELFKHYDQIVMTVEKTPKGVRVTETSDDPYVAKLIQAHARVVTKFIENGHDEARKNHAPPDTPVAKRP
jgi:hypothetical protein